MKKPLLEIKNLYYDYREDGEVLPVLENINLSVAEGEFVCIIGPSGCGKTTLFNILVGLEEPDEGEIILEDKEITCTRGHIAYMPQKDLLFPWRSVMENLLLGVEIDKGDLAAAREEAKELLPLFGLEGFADNYPEQLSGGMRQRAALLRTVLTHHSILALDEPFGALDALTRAKMQDWILSIKKELNKTILFITHDVEEAITLGQRVVVLNGRPSNITRELKIELPYPRKKTDPKFLEYKEELLGRLTDINF